MAVMGCILEPDNFIVCSILLTFGKTDKKTGRELLPARPIRRAVYIRPCCHLDQYCTLRKPG
jgi:hypothetical protein